MLMPDGPLPFLTLQLTSLAGFPSSTVCPVVVVNLCCSGSRLLLVGRAGLGGASKHLLLLCDTSVCRNAVTSD